MKCKKKNKNCKVNFTAINRKGRSDEEPSFEQALKVVTVQLEFVRVCNIFCMFFFFHCVVKMIVFCLCCVIFSWRHVIACEDGCSCTVQRFGGVPSKTAWQAYCALSQVSICPQRLRSFTHAPALNKEGYLFLEISKFNTITGYGTHPWCATQQ